MNEEKKIKTKEKPEINEKEAANNSSNEKAKKAGEEKKQDNSMKYLLIALTVLVFTAVHFYLNYLQPKEYNIHGIKVISKGNPEREMKEILLRNKPIIELGLFDAEQGDERNTAISFIVSDIAYTYGATNSNISIYGRVRNERTGEQSFVNGTCTEETDFCSNPSIIIAIDSCNCLKLEDKKLFLLFTAENYRKIEIREKIKGILGGILIQGERFNAE